MFRTHFTTVSIFSAFFACAGLSVAVPVALGQESTVQPPANDASDVPTLDAKSALLSAIALGYTDIRSAGRVGDYFQIEAIDTAGRAVRLYMDPETGVLIKIKQDM